MNFWMRAAPISVTAIGHTSFIAQAWDGGRRPPREAIFTLRESRFPAPPVFRAPARHRFSPPPRGTGPAHAATGRTAGNVPHRRPLDGRPLAGPPSADRLHPPTARSPTVLAPTARAPTTRVSVTRVSVTRASVTRAQFPSAHLPLFRVKSCGAEFLPVQEPRKPKAKVPFAATDLS